MNLISKIKRLRMKALSELTAYQYKMYLEMQQLNEFYLDELPYYELEQITRNKKVLSIIEHTQYLIQKAS